jgi:hypothetical protein
MLIKRYHQRNKATQIGHQDGRSLNQTNGIGTGAGTGGDEQN